MKRNLPEIIEVEVSLSLEELSDITRLKDEFIIEMIEQELIVPVEIAPEEWRFDSLCLKRVRTAASFHHDLDVNLPGVALALQLLNKIDELEKELNLLKLTEKHDE